MIFKKYKKQLLFPGFAVILVSCGGTPEKAPVIEPPLDVPYEVTEDYNSGIISYTVQRGDNLGDIAREFTGDAANWRQIAEFNSISNPRSLREGTVLQIPSDLIPGYERPTPAPVVQNSSLQTVQQTPSASLAVRRNEPVEIAPVVVSPISTNRDFELNPVEAESSLQSRSYSGTGKQVKVNGSYYPKGIYTEPAAYSRLIMRVAPGTVYSLDSQINQWYKIETDRGTGYIRTTDADIIN